MWEIWRALKKFKAKAPVAWFNEEQTAREYLEYLTENNIEATIHFNENAIFADYSAPSEWHEINE